MRLISIASQSITSSSLVLGASYYYTVSMCGTCNNPYCKNCCVKDCNGYQEKPGKKTNNGESCIIFCLAWLLYTTHNFSGTKPLKVCQCGCQLKEHELRCSQCEGTWSKYHAHDKEKAYYPKRPWSAGSQLGEDSHRQAIFWYITCHDVISND